PIFLRRYFQIWRWSRLPLPLYDLSGSMYLDPSRFPRISRFQIIYNQSNPGISFQDVLIFVGLSLLEPAYVEMFSIKCITHRSDIRLYLFGNGGNSGQAL